MAKKRKSENTGLDEVERTLYTSFCTAANSISHLYTQAQHQQKIAFQAGERHGLERLYHWLHREQHAGSNISVADIVNYLQNELDGEEMTVSPGPPFQQQLPLAQQQQQQHQHHLSSSNQVPPGAIGYPGLVSTGRLGGAVDQTKISVFAGALSSPNRRSLPPFPNVHGGYGSVDNGGAAGQHHEAAEEDEESNQEQPYNSSSLSSQTHTVSSGYGYSSLHDQHRESHTLGENDSSMDMHADGGSEGYYQ